MARTLVKKDRIPWTHLALFGWLPSALKGLAYRLLLGYQIGNSVQFGVFGVVVGKDVVLDDHVSIGSFAIVSGRRVHIGRHSSVGTFSYVACEDIEIGEDAKIREQVCVGGPQLPESRFVLGSRTIVLQMAYINPTKPVVIGDDTGIGGHCLIFTHGSWLNILDGYPVTFAPVTLGKSVWLPWRVFLMPGVTIGDGSVIAGFAGATADAFTLFERLETKLEQHPGNLARACVELAKDWRTDRFLRRLEAMMAVADATTSLILSGTGDVVEPEDGIIGIGSGGPYALAAARALVEVDGLDAETIARRSMAIAAGICIYTNESVTVESLSTSD